jgi:pimeloyl-ACP methyl ester carboxylesterase
MTTFVLVPGLWLGAWAWHEVTAALRGAGHDAYPLTLTGVADRQHVGGPRTDLDTHITDITALIETEELTDVVLVAHSYAGHPVTGAADRIPQRLRRVVYVDSGPLPNGMSHLDVHDAAEQDRIRTQVGTGWRMPPRDWDPEQDPVNLAGLSATALDTLRGRATPHPFGTLTQPLALTGAGEAVPRALIACTYPLDQVRILIEQQHPFFAGLADAALAGLPTGHWPMFSEPDALAKALASIA